MEEGTGSATRLPGRGSPFGRRCGGVSATPSPEGSRGWVPRGGRCRGFLAEREAIFSGKVAVEKGTERLRCCREGSGRSEGRLSVNEECITELERQSKEVEAGPDISYGNFWRDGEDRP